MAMVEQAQDVGKGVPSFLYLYARYLKPMSASSAADPTRDPEQQLDFQARTIILEGERRLDDDNNKVDSEETY